MSLKIIKKGQGYELKCGDFRFGQLVRNNITGIEGLIEQFDTRISNRVIAYITSKSSVDPDSRDVNTSLLKHLSIINEDKVDVMENLFYKNFSPGCISLGNKAQDIASDAIGIVSSIIYSFEGVCYATMMKEREESDIGKEISITTYNIDSLQFIDSKVTKLVNNKLKKNKIHDFNQLEKARSIIDGFEGVVVRKVDSIEGKLITLQEITKDNSKGCELTYSDILLDKVDDDESRKKAAKIKNKPTGCSMREFGNFNNKT